MLLINLIMSHHLKSHLIKKKIIITIEEFHILPFLKF